LETDKTGIKILSFLDGNVERTLCGQLSQPGITDYYRAEAPSSVPSPSEMISSAFWSAFPVDYADVVLLPVSSQDLAELVKLREQNIKPIHNAIGFWLWMPAAVVAVLAEDSIRDALAAAQLDFDGILAEPFHPDGVVGQLQKAIDRHKQKTNLEKRYHKLQRVFRQVNHKRRNLREKVDLLCHDLVQSNVEFTSVLRDLQSAYDFQSELTGEFDFRLMLFKALRQIKDRITESNAAIYLCATNRFDAHIVGAWYEQQDDIEEIETIFEKTIVPQVIETRQPVLVTEGAEYPDVKPKYRKKLAGLSLLALPVTIDNELLGVVTIYRNTDNPLQPKDKQSVLPFLPPFARAIESLQRLEHLLV